MITSTLATTRRLTAFVLVASVVGTVVCTVLLAWAHGYRMYVVHTGSMSPTFKPGDVVIDRTTKAGYRPGDVITVQTTASASDVVTHRMTRVDPQGKLHTKGDANKKPDAWALSPNAVRGVVQYGVPKLGYLVVFMRQKEGIAGVMTSALSIFLLWGLCFPSPAEEPATKREAAGPRLRIPRQRRATVLALVPRASVDAVDDDPEHVVVPAAAGDLGGVVRLPRPRGPRA
jgi:signal peptidase